MASESKSSLAHLLRTTLVSDLMVRGKVIVTVSTDETPVHAFQKIVSHKILSAPALDRNTGHYVGFLDTRDLVQFVVFQAEEAEIVKKHQVNTNLNLLEAPPTDLQFIFESAAKMYKQPLEGITVTYLARTHPFSPVHEDDTLLRVVELLAAGAHRVPVVAKNNADHIIDIISQSTVISFLSKHREQLHEELNLKLTDVKLGSRPVIPVNERQTALETFKTMARLNRSGIAIVDDRGAFVGNTSASDLKLFIRNPEANGKLLHVPIIEFLAHIRKAEVAENPDTRSPTISVHPTATVEKVIAKLAATHIHRLFVADDATGYKPEAVISITDVLRFLLAKSNVNSTKIIVESD